MAPPPGARPGGSAGECVGGGANSGPSYPVAGCPELAGDGGGSCGRALAPSRHCWASRAAPRSSLASPSRARRVASRRCLRSGSHPSLQRQASLWLARPASPASMPREVGGSSRGRDPHLGQPLPLPSPRGSRVLDRDPPGSRVPSGPSRVSLHVPKGPGQGLRPANRRTDNSRTITGAHQEVVPDPHPNLLFCFVAPLPRAQGPQRLHLLAVPAQREKWT